MERNWKFIQKIDQAVDERSIQVVLDEIVRPMGISSIFGGLVPKKRMVQRDIQRRILIQRFPDGWAERYNELGYVFRDPIVERLQNERHSFSWDAAYRSSTSAANVSQIAGEAADFGLSSGFVVPIMLLDGTSAAISFGGRRIQLSPDEESTLGFIASYAIGQLLQRRWRSQRTRGRISAREYDCLLWAAEGKTDWEISVILGLSKPTITKHILSAREKLGAVTKAHAIAIALRDKIIS